MSSKPGPLPRQVCEGAKARSMADYIYLLQNRLTVAQQAALRAVREVARTHSLTVFLVGGAVRDLTSGAPVRDLDLTVQGNALSLQKELEDKGGVTLGTDPVMQTLHMVFPGGVRLGVESALSVSYPKPGKPVTTPATILDDLRRRDFTANAMAISLNDGSFGLLMDPLNGVADIENRELRLVSNYGFVEDPARMLRGVRLMARSGWQFEEKTQQRYETGKAEGYIAAMGPASRAYEIEDIFHEEEPLRVLRRLEEEGWSQSLFPALQSSKANESELERLRDLVDQLQTMGIFPDPSAANFPLLTAKMAPKDIAELKKAFARPGFVGQIEALEAQTKEFANRFNSKSVASPSETWKLLLSSPPEQVLSLAYGSKSPNVQARLKAFFEEWPTARQRIPYGIMHEMRITPDLPGYDELIESLFFALMDGKLETPEAIKEFLAPYSPPAPPPPVNVRRRPAKRESKASKSKSKAVATEAAVPVHADADDVSENTSPPAGVPEAKEKPAHKKAALESVSAPAPKKTPASAKGVPTKAASKPSAQPPVKKTMPPPAKKATVVAAKQPAKKVTAKTTHRDAPPKKAVAPTAKKAAPVKAAAKPKTVVKTAPKTSSTKAAAASKPQVKTAKKAAKKGRR